MKIEKYPQYQLFIFTKSLNEKRDDLVPADCDNRCVYGTIINRAYYSAYTYASEWLSDNGFKLKHKEDFQNPEDYVSEHKQVRDALKEHDKSVSKNRLYKLSQLREKADYRPFEDLSEEEVDDSIDYMNKIINDLKFSDS